MKILVCGGRKYNNWGKVKNTLDSFFMKDPIKILIHGAASGADTLARSWGISNNLLVIGHPAQWTKYGDAAGPTRNSEMLENHPDIAYVVAFPGDSGTKDMIDKAKAKGIMVYEIS